jgi:hypothetical protein
VFDFNNDKHRYDFLTLLHRHRKCFLPNPTTLKKLFGIRSQDAVFGNYEMEMKELNQEPPRWCQRATDEFREVLKANRAAALAQWPEVPSTPNADSLVNVFLEDSS